jgi:hypothetical protein
MTQSDKALAILLRCLGGGSLFALIPVVMPFSWMAATHRWLGLGEMPTGPVVEYLARSLSAFYAVTGALCLVVAADLERYRPLVRFLGVAFALMSLVLLGVDLAAGMPWWWTASERPGESCSGRCFSTWPAPLTRKVEPHDPFAVRDVRLGARGRHAEGVTLPALSVVANQPGLPEVPAAARGPLRRLPEEGKDRRDF